MITPTTILATGPCADWTTDPGRIARTLAALDCSSWTALVESAAARGWVDVSIADARLTLCRAMTPAMRTASVKRSMFVRLDAQIERWPDVDGDVQAVRGELLAWAAGEREFSADDLREIRDHASAASASAAADAAADAAAAAYVAAYVAADACADAADAYAYAAAYVAADAYADAYADADVADAAADADAALAGLRYMARLLDGGSL